jgi:hypothetical protein
MKTTIQSIETELLNLVAIVQRRKPGQVTHKIEDIKALFQQEEPRIKRETLKAVEVRFGENQGKYKNDEDALDYTLMELLSEN